MDDVRGLLSRFVATGGEGDAPESEAVLAALTRIGRDDEWRGRTARERRVVAARLLRELVEHAPAVDETTGSDEQSAQAEPSGRPSRGRRVPKKRKIESGRGVYSDVECLPGIGPKSGDILRARGIRTVHDLLFLLPIRYDDERLVVPVGDLEPGRHFLTEGVVSSVRVWGFRSKRRAEVVLEPLPEHGVSKRALLKLVWFRAPPGMSNRFERGQRVRASGAIQDYRGTLCMHHPEVDFGGKRAGIVPRYTAVHGVKKAALQKAMHAALEMYGERIPDAIPEKQRKSLGVKSLGESLVALHRPPADLSDEELSLLVEGASPHHRRLSLEEFFLLELVLEQRRRDENKLVSEALTPRNERTVERAREALPFHLTTAQERSVREIADDMATPSPMRRLLQGDVGSGKTAVAMLAVARAVASGSQVALMAPTEVLAEQHFRSFAGTARALGLRMELVVGGARAAHRRKVRKGLAQGTIDLAIGTHALLSQGAEFRNLRLVIVDEQHRFGVSQRLRLVQKGGAPGGRDLLPHLLVMTATPIPRTLALALYGDLDVSVLDEMPPGRVPPVTRAYAQADREAAMRQIERALNSKGQVYVVCPAVRESDEHDMRAAERVVVELERRFGKYGVVLMHGQQSSTERQAAMAAFSSGDARVIVTTTVIEVGVDVPAANAILIEDAERFGLAQLHQLRGRVGRAGQKSACLLLHGDVAELAQERINVFCGSHNGFEIAEADLKLRGPGEVFGLRQSGLQGFRFADLSRDLDLLPRAREAAQAVIASDPTLARPEHAHTRQVVSGFSTRIVKEEAG